MPRSPVKSTRHVEPKASNLVVHKLDNVGESLANDDESVNPQYRYNLLAVLFKPLHCVEMAALDSERHYFTDTPRSLWMLVHILEHLELASRRGGVHHLRYPYNALVAIVSHSNMRRFPVSAALINAKYDSTSEQTRGATPPF